MKGLRRCNVSIDWKIPIILMERLDESLTGECSRRMALSLSLGAKIFHTWSNRCFRTLRRRLVLLIRCQKIVSPMQIFPLRFLDVYRLDQENAFLLPRIESAMQIFPVVVHKNGRPRRGRYAGFHDAVVCGQQAWKDWGARLDI
jgi:hypothetical protein